MAASGQESGEATGARLAKVREAYSRWDREKEQSFDLWFDLLDDNVEFHSLGAGAPGIEFTRVCGCKDDIRRYFAGLAADWEMQHFTPKTFVADENWVVMLGECAWKNRRTGKVFATPKADFLRFADDKVVEVREFFDTAGALAATQG